MSGLFGSLHVGVSGLQTGMRSMNTTAHNIANVDTQGYVRQNVTQADRAYLKVGSAAVSSSQVGMGASVADVSQFRDIFLDRKYRTEAGKAGYYEAMFDASYEIESYFQENFAEENQASMSKAITELQYAMNEMAKDPENSVNKEYFVLKSTQFLERAQNIYTAMSEYQDRLNGQIKTNVDRVNQLGRVIYEMNTNILSVEAGNIEDANDYRDTRNLALDELSKLVDITYETEANGTVTVKVEGTVFVNAAQVYEMDVRVDDPSTGFYTPIWKHTGNTPVFQQGGVVSGEYDNDNGYLKGLVMARGDHRGTYADIEILNRAADAKTMTDTEVKKAYKDTINNSVVTKAQAEFDQFVHGIVVAINDVLCTNTSAKDGKSAPEELFVRNTMPERFQNLTTAEIGATGGTKGDDGFYVDANGAKLTLKYNETTGKYEADATGEYTLTNDGFIVDKDGYYVMNEEVYNAAGEIYRNNSGSFTYKVGDVFSEESLYTISNIMINPDIVKNVANMSFKTDSGEVDMDRAAKLANVWELKNLELNPLNGGKLTFNNYYTSYMNGIGNNTQKYENMYDKETDASTSVDNQRQGVMGVNSDEELTNMIRYQNAYNAASRYINVVNEMLEHLLTSLG